MKKVVLAILFTALILGADIPIPVRNHAGTLEDPWIVYNSETLALNADMYEMDLSVVEIQIGPAEDFTTISKTIRRSQDYPKNNPVKVFIYEDVKDLPNGIYWLRGRVMDESGNASAWSAPLAIRKNWVTIPKPGGCFISF